MKNFLLITFLFLSVLLQAQVPQLINYQAVARDNQGNALQNTAVSVRFTVRDVAATGTPIYQETQSATTNQFGLFSVSIGSATPVLGTFAGINWGTGNKYLQVELDPAGGSNYIDMGTTQLVSVPYALYAKGAAGADTALYSANANEALHAGTADTALHAATANAALHAGTADTALYAASGGTPVDQTLIKDTDGNTKVQVEANPNENLIRFTVGGTEYYRMERGRIQVSNTAGGVMIGDSAGANDNLANRSVFLGYFAGYTNTTGPNNIAAGNGALGRNISGGYNVAFGYGAAAHSLGDRNVAIGMLTMRQNQTGNDNVGIGYNAGYSNTNGNDNVFLGKGAGRGTVDSTRSNNTIVGSEAGYSNNGSGNVFLGKAAGYNETGSNKLYVDNSNTATPLIYGDFGTNSVTVNDSLTSKYLRVSNGAATGYVLTSDATGNGTWQAPGGVVIAGTSIAITGSGSAGSPYVVNYAAATYTIGLHPELGGYVFRISADGKHGLVAETADQGTFTAWYSAQDVISNPANHSTSGQAFMDWRLPTKYELNEMYGQAGAIGGFSGSLYWSSTESDSGNAWRQSMVQGQQDATGKTANNVLRSVRAF